MRVLLSCCKGSVLGWTWVDLVLRVVSVKTLLFMIDAQLYMVVGFSFSVQHKLTRLDFIEWGN